MAIMKTGRKSGGPGDGKGNGDDFRKAFAQAKKSGAKKFTYKGKEFTTQTAAEKARGMSDSELKKAAEKSYVEAKLSGGTGDKGFFKSKSHNEIAESYTREQQYRMGDKLKKQGLDPSKYSDRMKGNFTGSAYALPRPSNNSKKKK